jgi:EAL domain-containing protein (putative c-di-GMP-specific phosphodiesterase class I)
MSDRKFDAFATNYNNADVQCALAGGHFVPFFQPIVRLGTSELIGLEILARWLHPEAGLILPDSFIPHAEKYDWIDTLTRQMLDKAFASTTEIPDSVTLSINISPVQFHNPKLAELLQGVAERAGFDLNRLVIEITESTLIDNLAVASDIARKLKKMGCSISLDDFGMGCSGMFHLNALPFDELKIDRSFVGSLLESWESRTIVSTFVDLARNRGLRVVAEGVETAQQADILMALGCRFGQGWLYGSPASLNNLPGLIQAVNADRKRDALRPGQFRQTAHLASMEQRVRGSFEVKG